MPKFIPRQRKHKVLARSKNHSNNISPDRDTNIVEYTPPAKAALEEKKLRLREELQSQGPKVSGKKAKRLEKYIDTKLRKDANRALIEKLALTKVDTSLYQSSRRLGQGRETKREQLGRALRDENAGVDIDGDNEHILFDKRPEKSRSEELSTSGSEDDNEVILQEAPLTQSVATPSTLPSFTGAGLKRPLEVDEEGKPVLKKRKRRGGVKSKLSFIHMSTEEELEWEGFSSLEGPAENSGLSGSDNGRNRTSSPEGSTSSEGSTDELEEAKSSFGEDGSNSEESETAKIQRSSAFKAWASQQINEAMGYQPASTTQNATETQKINTHTPRAPEEDPLPTELLLSTDVSRTAFSVSVVRTPEIQTARLRLPVVAEEQMIMEAIHNHPTVVIYGATGSGKTTQVPQFLYEAGYGASDSTTPGIIGITQPRRVAAVSMAKRVGDELGNHGHRVGYQIRFEGTVSHDTAIKFMTDGVLLREIAQDIALRKYSAIVIDEAHERTVNTDILVGMMSRIVKLREEMALENPSIKPLKLIIMSATLRVTDFTNNTNLFAVPPPVLQVEGRQYPVTSHFARKTHHDYVEDLFRKISRGHRKLPPGGFLVFLTGQNEITHLSKKLKEAFRISTATSGPRVRISGHDVPMEAEDVDFGDIPDDEADSDEESQEKDLNDDGDFEVGETDTGPLKMHILPLYSLLPTQDQLRVFEPPPDGARLVVLATNVAETSLTIPGIRYVFDCGRSKERKYDCDTGVQSFEVGWISKASASQRAGRAGRTGPGHCYRSYSSAVYERDFQDFAKPEILRMPIEGVVLQLKAMNLQHVVNFPFPTPPDRHSLANSEKLLSYLSAISPLGKITPAGITMSMFPLSPRFARILLIGHLHDCISYTIALVAGLSAADVFIPQSQAIPATVPKDQETHLTNEDRIQEDVRASKLRAYNKVHKEFCFLDDKSDAIKLLQVVGEYGHEPTEAWCTSHFVRSKPLKEILQFRRQITDLLRTNIPAFKNLNFQEKLPPPSSKQVKAIKQMAAAGFIDHIAMRADLSPTPTSVSARRKPNRAIDVPYLTLLPSNIRNFSDGEGEVDKAVYIHPSSPLAHLSPQECPDYIIYSYLQRSSTSSVQLSNGDYAKPKTPKTRMHALTDITGGQLAALAKGTPLISYGKPIKEIVNSKLEARNGDLRECWVVPYLRAEGVGGMGWPLPARRVVQRKVPGRGWVVE